MTDHSASPARAARLMAGLGTASQAAAAFANDPKLNNEQVRSWTILRDQIEEVTADARQFLDAMEPLDRAEQPS